VPGSSFSRRARWPRVAIVTLSAVVLSAGVAVRPARAAQIAAATARPADQAPVAAGPVAVAAQAPDLRAAIRQIERRGYRSEAPDTYSFSAWLRGALGKERQGSVQGADNRSVYDARGFLFDGDRFRGRDSLTPRAGLRVAWQSDGTLALQSALYQPGDAICCPSGGHTFGRVRVEDGPAPPEAMPAQDAGSMTARR